MSQTLNDFNNFFKPTEKKEYQLLKVARDVSNMLNGIYHSKGITINLIENDDSLIDGYPTELMQVLINILNNARDAILETQCEQMEINIEVTSDEDFGIIHITDFAGGIPDHIIDKIFKPYFTTKSKDKGTGIGLDMSMSIIKKAKGKLSVSNIITVIDDKKYKGACFTIKLKKD